MKKSDYSVIYPHEPIRSVESLARALHYPLDTLISIVDNANNLYREKLCKKPGKKARLTYPALEPLKSVQKQIKKYILDVIAYPTYLLGGIKGRDYLQNAQAHMGSKIIINEDIASFFDSCPDKLIFNFWKYCLHFSEEVSRCLTRLTTYNGFLPQGTSTSPQLANLIFWYKEPMLCKNFEIKGYGYTRFVDDITISSKNFINPEEKTKIIAMIYGILVHYELKPKRSKHKIYTSSEKMLVTNIAVNKQYIHPGKEKIENIRVSIFQLENDIKANGFLVDKHATVFNSIEGRIKHIERILRLSKSPLIKLSKLKNRLNELRLLNQMK